MNSSRYGFIFSRLLGIIPLVFGILLLVMLLLSLTPGDPARLALGARASQENVEVARHQMGLDLPIWERYFQYVGNFLQGDLGTSFKTGQSVSAQIFAQLPITIAIAVAGVVLAVVISVPLAIVAARYSEKAPDHIVRGLNVLGVGLPTFWIAIMLITFVAMPTGWFPVAGIGTSPLEFIRSLFLPAFVVAIAISPPMIRSLRSTLLELESAEYVLAARTIGFKGFPLLEGFVLKNAVPPLVTVVSLQANYALFGAVIVEVAFGLPGMGQGLITAASTRDFPLVQGYTVFFAVLVVIIYLISDIVTAAIDPRIRVTS